MQSHLELGLAAQQRNGKVVHRGRFKGIVVPVPRLHDVVIRQPFHGRVGVLIHRGRVEGDGLVVSDVAPAFAFAGEEFGVEAPGDDGVDDELVGAVDVELLRDGEELPLAAGAGSKGGCGLDYEQWDWGGERVLPV